MAVSKTALLGSNPGRPAEGAFSILQLSSKAATQPPCRLIRLAEVAASEGSLLAVRELGHPASLGRRRSQVRILPARPRGALVCATRRRASWSCANRVHHVMLFLLHRTAKTSQGGERHWTLRILQWNTKTLICGSDCLSVMRPWLRIRYPETMRRTGIKRSEWRPSAANPQIRSERRGPLDFSLSGHPGMWRSLVAHSAGGRGVAGSNPVIPTQMDSSIDQTAGLPSGR